MKSSLGEKGDSKKSDAGWASAFDISPSQKPEKPIILISYRPSEGVKIHDKNDNMAACTSNGFVKNKGRQPILTKIDIKRVEDSDRNSTLSGPVTPIRQSAAYYSFVDLNDE